MDGFTLRRAHPGGSAIARHPGDPGHLARGAGDIASAGRDVGAQGYIVKSEFDQAELLR